MIERKNYLNEKTVSAITILIYENYFANNGNKTKFLISNFSGHSENVRN
jgi:hypothetical protein